MDEVLGRDAIAHPDHDGGVQIQLFSRSNELLPKAAKLEAWIRKEVDDVTISDPAITEVGIKSLLSFPNVKSLYLNDMKVWNPAVNDLIVGWPKLKSVWAQDMGLTNKELAVICQAKHLQCLMADGNNFTTGGLKPLEDLDDLRQLGLSESKINDDDILHLRGKKQLVHIWLGDTDVTEAGVKELELALPKNALLIWNAKP